MYLLVASRYFLYLFDRGKSYDFWDWLFARVCNQESADYRKPRLVWFLLAQAIELGEHHQVVAVYNYFKDIVDSKATETYRRKIDESIVAAEKLQGKRETT